jgi:cell division protein FtsI (penicillin-binding protein 3)
VLKLPSRLTLIGSGFALAALAVVGRAAQLQLFQRARWQDKAAAQQTTRVALPARRGTLFDRNRVALAVSRETYGIGVAPRELDDEAEAALVVAKIVDQPRAEVAARIASDRVWVEWPGPFTWNAVAAVRNMHGVHLLRRLERFYPREGLAPHLIGRLDQRGRGASGIERSFDTLLAGRAGNAIMLRDERGRLYPAPSRPAAEPIDGADVVLTLDAELQEIAERALARAVTEAKATGGDVVILQPRTGEVLAMASVRRGSGGSVGVISDPYEPGSTAKIFTAAGLLRTGKATPHDSVFAEHGTWIVPGRRPIHDTHPAGMLSLSDVIRVSSNIGIAKLGARLTPAEQFQVLRDFGFGVQTGIEFPQEAPGRLRRPAQWTTPSAAALAMGYEMSVTPLQLACAYGALANGGLLIEPTLLREVKDPGGSVRWTHQVRPVRRAVTKEVASQLSHMLLGVVEEGTGRRAALGTYAVAGKTGTSRHNVGGRYERDRYYATFVGYFPATDPQLVLLVKIDDPEGDYFGGGIAAPVTRTILEAALATPAVTLDRSRLSRRQAPAAPEAAPLETFGEAVTLSWPLPRRMPKSAAPQREVPDVSGETLRAAVRALHRAGFQVRVSGWGEVTGTNPAAGARADSGTTVIVRSDR